MKYYQSLPGKYKFILLASLFALISMLQLWFSYVTFNYSYIGVSVVQSQGQWVINQVAPDGEGAAVGLKVGDVVVQINHKPPSEHETVRWGEIESIQNILAQRSNQSLDFDIQSNHLSWKQFSSRYLSQLCFEIFCYGISVFLFYRRYQENALSGYYLALLFLCLGLTMMSVEASSRGDIVAKIIVENMVSFIPVILLRFISEFVRERDIDFFPTRFLKWFTNLLLIPLIIRFGYLIPFHQLIFYVIIRNLALISFSLGILINIFTLVYVYIKYKNHHSYLANLIQTIGWALIVSFFPFICLSVLPDIIYGFAYIPYNYTYWFISFFPLSFIYIFFTRRLFDIHLLIRRITFLSLLSSIPSIILLGIFILVSQNKLMKIQYFILFIFIFAFIIALLSILETFNERFEEYLFPRKSQLDHVLDEIIIKLGSVTSYYELRDAIISDIVKTLEITGAMIQIEHEREGKEVVVHGFLDEKELSLVLDTETSKQSLFYIFYLHQDEDYRALLILGNKLSNTRLSKQEIHWLHLLKSYLSVSLDNLYLIRKLTVKLIEVMGGVSNGEDLMEFSWLRKSIFLVQERERERIATDLHDTVLQDIYFVKQKLGLLKRNATIQDVQETISAMVEHLDLLNTNLRDACFQLYPHLLKEIGLFSAVQKMVSAERLKVKFDISLQVQDEELFEALPLNTKNSLFRILQELLNNAKKHSLASKVTIRFWVEQGNCKLEYQDNGIGIQLGASAIEQGRIGMGLIQIKNRVIDLNGLVEIATGLGEGVCVFIQIPFFQKAAEQLAPVQYKLSTN